MKKWLLILGLCLVIAGCKTQSAFAELSLRDVLQKIPATNAGIFYNLNESKFEFTSTFRAAVYKEFNLNIGFATPETAILGIGYEIVNLEKYGVKIPVLKDIIIDAGWNIGWKKLFNENEFCNGPSATLKIKF